MLPVIPQAVNKLIQDETGQLSTFPFPPNVAADLSKELRQKIYGWMLNNYLWPQIMERKPYEDQWDKLLQMVRASWHASDTNIPEGTRLDRARNAEKLDAQDTVLSERIKVSDTLIFDAVDRLTNLNHFISFKEDLPVRYEIPQDVIFPHENESYSPMSSLVKSANAWLRFNSQNQNVYRKHWMTSRHHYTYGVSFVDSQFIMKIENVMRRQPDKSFQAMPELTDIGIGFEPLSLRKLWLNHRLSPYNMEYQPCPFFFEEVPRFALSANPYDPQVAPFGYLNLESLPSAQYLFGGGELESYAKAFQQAYPNAPADLTQVLDPKYNVELLWTMYPMLPLGMGPDGQWIFDEDGSQGYPLKRYIVQTFGNNLVNGNQEIVRIQENFYPNNSLPLYGSAHMPDLDSGTYSPAIGTILEGHYIQICKALSQYIENKDWINDPSHKVIVNSPAMTKDLNAKGQKIPVNSMKDVEQVRQAYDATQTTPVILEWLRNSAQTTSKAVDAILGKAMGSRTSATEAGNIFQTAMSGVTTDINLFNHDIMGGYATRVWDYTGRWVDPDVLAAVTGSYGFAIRPEHLSIRLGLKWDIGSTYIESLTRQNNIRYILESSPPGDPAVNRPKLIKLLLAEWKFPNIDEIVNDGGQEKEYQIANEQAIQTYLGQLIMIDPDQNHQLAIKVKKSYLADRNSVWNSNPSYVQNGYKLVQQIQMHQYWLQLQLYQMQVQQLQMLGQQQNFALSANTGLPNPPAPPPNIERGGQIAQTNG